MAQGSDIHLNISPALTEHYQEHVFKNQDSLLLLSFSGVQQKCMANGYCQVFQCNAVDSNYPDIQGVSSIGVQ